MYNKHNIALHKVASRSSIRPEFACVAFYGDRTVATDTFRLIEMSATGKKKEKPVLYTARSLETVKLKKGDEVDEKTMAIKPADGIEHDYPDVDKILQPLDDRKYAEVKVNAAYLAEICTILKGLDPFQAVTLKVPTEATYYPIVIEARGPMPKEGEPQRARALLMPMNR